MAPSSNLPPSNQPHPSPLNALLQKKAKEARDSQVMGSDTREYADEKQGTFRHAVVDILPRPRTKMNRPQNAETFEEGDYCPIEPERVQRKRNKFERVQRRQKLVIQKRRIKKRRRVFLQRLKRFSNLMAFFLLSVMIWVMMANPMWTLNTNQPFALHNARFISKNQLAPILKPYNHFPIYEMDPRTVESRAKKRYPIIEHLYVRRSLFPARLDITVVEKTPFAAIYHSPQDKLPSALATFTSDSNQYDAISRAPYTFTKSHEIVVPKIILSNSANLTQKDWQYIDTLLGIIRENKTLPLIALELLPIPKSSQSHVHYAAIIHYPNLVVLAGGVDAEITQRVARMSVLSPKIQEMKQQIHGVDLRWSEQITFLKKDSPLPQGVALWNPNPPKAPLVKNEATNANLNISSTLDSNANAQRVSDTPKPTRLTSNTSNHTDSTQQPKTTTSTSLPH